MLLGSRNGVCWSDMARLFAMLQAWTMAEQTGITNSWLEQIGRRFRLAGDKTT